MSFSAHRLTIARQRRKLTGKELGEIAGLTPVTVSKAENGHQVEPGTAERLAAALGFPLDFFYLEAPEMVEADTVSFRSLKKMSAAERDASLAAGSLGVELYGWIDNRFDLPEADLIDLNKERSRPESAARLLRQHWGLGDRPIGNMLKLLESKGVRVLSLSENTLNVDAYSFWRGDHPYIFLNQEKSAERSIFDSAHELGHLVLHHHAGARNDKGAEFQADQFASAFLMPEHDVKNELSTIVSPQQIIRAKSRWRVSAMALAYRLHSLNLLSDWNYRSFCIELGKLGYRSGEPQGVERETSVVLAKVLTALWTKRLTKAEIASDLAVPTEEVESLIFGLAGPSAPVGSPGSLELVQSK
ncbi:MAG: ImmA/IrrE family metallo-endopeptidase [Sphingomonas sp.]|uniref:helix-turn-helix domain-containing protein n=1 Tax=Sphingomonas sp. TaxID=28214 RepID=UPI001AD4333E|nr:ImmA/IrrE family metallo-endopeptidase [Sphingomonas sp.]MBN8809638.1 ImmA/IrrE family metallo-endopeptidase [Sphingomonas sp.]